MSDVPPPVHPLDLVSLDEEVVSFFGTPGVGSALRASKFDIQEEVETLIRHFRDPDPKISLRAHGRLRSVLKEVATASGLLTKQEISQTDPGTGTTMKVSATAARIANKMKGLDVKIPISETGRPDFAAKYLPASKGGIESDPTSGAHPTGGIGHEPGGDRSNRGSGVLRPGSS